MTRNEDIYGFERDQSSQEEKERRTRQIILEPKQFAKVQALAELMETSVNMAANVIIEQWQLKLK